MFIILPLAYNHRSIVSNQHRIMKKTVVIALANRKGGVAKTTSVAALLKCFHQKGFKVLGVDLDSQANLTTTFLKEVPDDTVTSIFERKPLPIHHISKNFDLVAADVDLAAVEQILTKPDDRKILMKALSSVKENYDIILLDCPPSLSWLTINALSASDFLFVPIDTDKKSLDGVAQMAEACYQSATPSRIDGIFFTIYEPRLNVSKKMAEIVHTKFGSTLMETKIRKCTKIPECSHANMDVISYAPTSPVAEDYRKLAEEIMGIVGLTEKA